MKYEFDVRGETCARDLALAASLAPSFDSNPVRTGNSGQRTLRSGLPRTLPSVEGNRGVEGNRIQELYLLSSSQRDIWFDQVLHGSDVPLYNIGGYTLISGHVEAERFERAVNLLVQKHDNLRTLLVEAQEEGGLPLQTFAAEMQVKVPLHDFSAHADPRAAALAWMAEQMTVPFVLFGQPLFRYSLLKIEEECFCWSMQYHHLIADGWTTALLSRSLGALYTALEEGGEGQVSLQLSAPSYTAFIRDDEKYLESERFQQHRRYWLEKYPAAPEPLFNSRYHAEFERVAPSGSRTVSLTRALYDRVIAFAKANQSTTYHVFLAVLYVYFSRTSRRSEVVMGLPVLNRANATCKATAGVFVGVSAIKLDFGADSSFRDLMTGIGQVLKRDYRHQRFPISELNREVVLRQAGRQQLFDLSVSYERHDFDVWFGRAKAETIPVLNQCEQTPLTLSIREFHAGQDVRLDFVYNRAYFTADEIEGLQERVLSVLEFVLTRPAVSISAIPLLAPKELAQLERWNCTGVERRLGETVVELFERRAASSPHALAVSLGERQLTYQQLNDRANRLAHCLIREHGVVRDTLVGIFSERSPELVIGLLAILKAGGAYLPLDPAYPPDRLRFILEDSGAPLLLTRARESGSLPPHNATVVLLDREDLRGPIPSGNPELRAGARDLAYVIYTSGSTGQPKGVLVEHRSLANLVAWHAEAFELGVGQSSSSVASIGFDAAVWEIWSTLGSGATLMLPDAALAQDPEALLLWWQAQDLDVSFLPTPLAELAFARGLVSPHLRCCLVGGDRLRRLPAPPSAFRLINNYGPTETAVVATSGMIVESDRILHIGRPIANTTIHILDAQSQRAPIGVAGEIYIGGVGVARGYLGRPELTAEYFVPDPFASEPNARMYKSGDLGRYLPDGNIEFLGRADFQVKIRGFRVELGEIEARLTEHPAIRDAVVMARDEQADRERLVAYVTESAISDDEALRLSQRQIAEWSELYDREYDKGDANDSASGDAENGFDIVGWNSSYTRLPIPAQEMRDWLDGAIARIRGLQPRRVLEVGCGTGMILLNVAPECELYVGTDLSRTSIAQLGRQVARRAELSSKVRLVHGQALEFSDVPVADYDTIVLNSVIQYFPSSQYLLQVLERAIGLLGASGQIFIGDVRHCGLLEAFHLSVQLQQCAPETTVAQLRARVSQKVRSEPELLIAPAWFYALKERFPQIQRIEILPKQAKYQNELSAYRYDVVLSLQAVAEVAPDLHWIDWQSGALDWEELEARIESAEACVLGLRSIVNPRVDADVAALKRLQSAAHSDSRTALPLVSVETRLGVSCSELAAFCREHEYEVQFSWFPEQADGSYHAVIAKSGRLPAVDWLKLSEHAPQASPPSCAANDPLRARRRAALPEQLRAHLQSLLPEYMVPATYVVLDALPLTPHGKLDRRALCAPDGGDTGRRYEPPQGEIEVTLAKLWAELLMLERVGRHDHFFELGGHSLLAVSLIERMRQAGLPSDMSTLFFTPTLAELAASVRPDRLSVEVVDDRIPPGTFTITPEMLPLVRLSAEDISSLVSRVPGGPSNVQDVYPLTALQQGMLFHYLGGNEGDPYLITAQFGFETRSLLDRYLEALQTVIDRHDALRTSVLWEELPEPVQVILRKVWLPVEEVTLDSSSGDTSEQLDSRFDPRGYRLDVRTAPLLRAVVAHDAANQRWVLLLLLHHLVVDHSALAIIQHEIRAHLRGEAEQLPAPVRFRNFVVQARLGMELEDHAAFFKQMLGDVETPTVPFGIADLQNDRSAIAEASRLLEPTLARRLRQKARAFGVSAASVCHLAWAQVLARLTGRDDVVFGSVLFGRAQGGASADRAVGMFINTLPVRIRVGEHRVEESLRRTHALLSVLLRHEHAPLALAQRSSGVPAPLPLFNTLLNYRHSTEVVPTARLTLVDGIVFLGVKERTNYPITFSVDDLGEGFRLSAQVVSTLDPARICAFMDTALERLVAALERTPAAAIGSVDVLPAAERRQHLQEWNGTAPPAERLCVHELFEQQSARAPEAIAAVYEGGRLSYGELNAQSNRLARHLRVLGVTPETRVAICVERSLEMLVAVLAVLKAGGAYVPLDPSYPTERLSYMLEDSAPLVILTQRAAAERLAAAQSTASKAVNVLDLNADSWRWENEADSNLERRVTGLLPEDLAYVIYTSGSTGRPKGVMVEHGNLSRLFSSTREWFATGQEDVWTVFHSISFDFSVWEIWGALICGARLVVVPKEVTRSPREFYELLCREGVTVLNQTPSAFRQLVVAERESEQAHRLRWLIFGGEALEPASLRPWYGRARNARTTLVNMYGITETTVHATYRVLEPADAQREGASPIGRRLPDLKLYLLDHHRRPVPLGVAGEIYIGGAGVARGYLNQPKLTAERFLRDPFASEAGARMYKSGDLGRYLPDGSIEFLGRNDEQVKIRGYRIELGEIEARLSEHAAIRECVVLAREDSPGEQRLVAYYTLASEALGARPGELGEALRAHLSATLPEYMLPAAYVQLDALPLTVNGKLDRRALPAPDAASHNLRGYQTPLGAVESTIARIWSDVLKLGEIGRQDHFFELGGQSLLAVRVISALREALGVEVSVKELFSRPVLSDFARVVERAGPSALSTIRKVERTGNVVLSFAQQRLWFLAQLPGVSQAYHLAGALRLQGTLDASALKRALDDLVARHEVLRTTFRSVDGEPLQFIAPEATGFVLLHHDLRAHPSAQAELQRLAAEEAVAPFDLFAGPLIRGRLLELDADEHVLLITMHHIVSDGWSLGILLKELAELYAAHREDRAATLPALEIQYADYAAWQREWFSGERLASEVSFWQRELAHAPVLLELPRDRERPAQQDHRGALLDFEIEAELCSGLKALGQRHGATLFMTLLAGWALLLARLADVEEVVIGSPVANRTRAEVEPLLGFFVNTLALRLDVSGSPTVAEVLGRVKAKTLQAQQHQELPFEQVVELVHPPRSLAHSPVFQVMFAWQNNEDPELVLPGLKLTPIDSPYSVAKFDLTLSLRETGGRILGGLEYASALFEPHTIERHLGYFRNLLEAMVTDDEQLARRLPLLSAPERRQLLQEWNVVEPCAAERCVHELFEAAAARTPETIAVVHEGQTLSYGELNRRSNQLAHALRKLGVKPESRVALCLERSLEMLVGLLAILKAGGAYVPLDPSYPSERIAYMLEDCAPVLVLTQPQLVERLIAARPQLANSLIALELDEHAWCWHSEPDENLERSVTGLSPEHLQYVIYTSGSTGRPKGVMVEHGSVSRLFSSTRAWLDTTQRDVWSLFHSISFDLSVWEIWGALVQGARLVMVPQEVTRSPRELYELFCREKVTILTQTPSAFRQLVVAEGESEESHHLRWVIFGGEALDAPSLKPWFERARNRQARLVNMYGITETTVHATHHIVTPSETERHGASLIGYRLPDLKLYLLDRLGEPVPVGVPGEIYVGGPGVARGYLNRAELTAERFLRDPFATEPGARMYKSGDLARFLSDGSLEFLGRNDTQVKIRGFRIELGEVEARLAEHPGVRDAVVLAREDIPGDQRLVAYYTLASDALASEPPLTADALRAHLSASLPHYMLPAAYVALDALPLTANGKLNRQALMPPQGQDHVAARDYEAPRGDIEITLARIWADLLKLERVGRHDHFFELGGHSLLAVSLIERMRQEQLHADVRTLFLSPTLACLAGAARKVKEIAL